jgi:hypothetical protein
MRQSLLAVVLVSFIAAPAWSQVAKPNLTGTWSLDVAKSDFGPSPPPESIVHVIDHKDPNITITTTARTEAGESTNRQNLSTDGKENVNKIQTFGVEREMRSTGKWDGEKVLMSTKFDIQGAQVEFNDSWTLAADGKVLTLVRSAKTPQGDISVKTVYNKQP